MKTLLILLLFTITVTAQTMSEVNRIVNTTNPTSVKHSVTYERNSPSSFWKAAPVRPATKPVIQSADYTKKPEQKKIDLTDPIHYGSLPSMPSFGSIGLGPAIKYEITTTPLDQKVLILQTVDGPIRILVRDDD